MTLRIEVNPNTHLDDLIALLQADSDIRRGLSHQDQRVR